MILWDRERRKKTEQNLFSSMTFILVTFMVTVKKTVGRSDARRQNRSSSYLSPLRKHFLHNDIVSALVGLFIHSFHNSTTELILTDKSTTELVLTDNSTTEILSKGFFGDRLDLRTWKKEIIKES